MMAKSTKGHVNYLMYTMLLLKLDIDCTTYLIDVIHAV